jgi:hypothetical protein
MMKTWLLRIWNFLLGREKGLPSVSGEKKDIRKKEPRKKAAPPRKKKTGPPEKSLSEIPSSQMPEREDGSQAPLPPKPQRRKMGFGRKKVAPLPETEKKIPVLDADADLFVLMGGDPEKEGPAREPDLPEKEILGEAEPRVQPPLWSAPEKTLDLHGLNIQQAEIRMRSAILTARVEGVYVMRIVTGKGLHSRSGTAILREYTENFLVQLQKNGEIRAYKWEGKTKAKSGAVWVRLPDIP